ncbi:MAG: oligopeptidase A [Betaproteobacteria bacterium RIFCSPLOWO2_12_FULL_63_13]|nr:MAG: oligopeptidase A [Betaproteobacteria bacterium RIFCSPLOWO2_12_FULL_63_13]
MNPLLDFGGLPLFGSVKPEHVTSATDALLGDARTLIIRLTAEDTPASWDEFVEPLENANERLARAWGVVAHLHGVDDNEAIRKAYNDNLPKITQYYTEVAQNLGLYRKFKELAASPEFSLLDDTQRKILADQLRDFRLGGAELPPDRKQRFGEIQQELAALSAKFSENLLDATNAFTVTAASEEEIAGIPEDAIQAAHEAAQKNGATGWRFTLHAPSYMPVMRYAKNRALREQLYRAYVTRASEFGPPALDNTPLIAAQLKLRREMAQLLGYANYAEVSLVPKMAQSPREVLTFLDDLARKALPFARRDWAELTEFASLELGLNKLEACDVPFASERLRQQRFTFSDQEVKQYFPEHKVLEGMFRVVETIYGIRIERDSADTWHPDVRFYRIVDPSGARRPAEKDGLLGRFYLDPYARETKRGGAWMDEAISRRLRNGSVQVPVAYLVCNFSPPVGAKPALFTHDEVITLFHEFGHGLHHLLSRVDYLGASGMHGVEWDAVELPSQFMENFCWEWDVLRHMTAHVDTGEPLPRPLFEKMLAAKNFQSGMQTVRQLEFSLFDMHLHYDFQPEGEKTPLALLEEIRERVAVSIPPAYNRFPNNFSHIFAGGYDAGYYSYKWAEVLSADAYSLFEEQAGGGRGVLDPGTGARFRDEILAVGGARPAIESFRAFRGREPRVDALLRHNGMIPA